VAKDVNLQAVDYKQESRTITINEATRSRTLPWPLKTYNECSELPKR
jgi:hypothetical protein